MIPHSQLQKGEEEGVERVVTAETAPFSVMAEEEAVEQFLMALTGIPALAVIYAEALAIAPKMAAMVRVWGVEEGEAEAQPRLLETEQMGAAGSTAEEAEEVGQGWMIRFTPVGTAVSVDSVGAAELAPLI
jgi:hypothetical protein